MNRVFVTGAAGFIGSHVVDALLAQGLSVVGWDNLSTGRVKFLETAMESQKFQLITGDNLNLEALTLAMSRCDFVFHLAANADIQFGTQSPSKDFRQNTVATFNVLEAMRVNGIRKIAFSSTSAVYGEASVIPTPEDHPMPIQTSLYGASKLACEGMIQAYCESFGFDAWIFRFVGIVGPRYTHGHIRDFVSQLLEHPERLSVLGDGTQIKSYLDVSDCVEAILSAVDQSHDPTDRNIIHIYNLGTDEDIRLSKSAEIICGAMGLSPAIKYGVSNRGWLGDNPHVRLDTERIKSIGWRPTLTIREGITRTVQWIKDNQWILNPPRQNDH